jgi:cytochrome c-type biogenesis protein CcmH/NrfF
MGEEKMKQVDAYVDSVYHQVGGHNKEIEELKTEMKSHLLEAVYDLKLEGKTEQEAIEIAIERFGGEKEMRVIVGQLFQAQKLFAKWVLYTSVIFFLLTFIIFFSFSLNHQLNMNERNSIHTKISKLLGDSDVVSHEVQEEIKTLVKESGQISKVQIYNIKNIDDVFGYIEYSKPNFEYKQNIWVPKTRFIDLWRDGQGDSNWFIFFTYRSFDNLGTLALLVGIAAFYPLFSIWAIINAYHQKRLNAAWIIIFIIFNVIGYLLYYLIGKRINFQIK